MEEDSKKRSKESQSASKDKKTRDTLPKKTSRRLRDFLAGGDLHEEPPKSSSKTYPENSKEQSQDDEKKNETPSEAHEFHFTQELMKFEIFRKLRLNKQQVIRIIGGVIGVIFIVGGVLYIFGSADRVADNVVSGERAVISAFLVLIGFLIIAGIFARQILARTFLKNLHEELEVAEDESSNKDKSSGNDSSKLSSEGKEKQKDNIEEKNEK